MLVLTRAAGEGFTVDGPAKIKVMRSRAGFVRIGIDAEPHVQIVRDNAIDRGPKTPPGAAELIASIISHRDAMRSAAVQLCLLAGVTTDATAEQFDRLAAAVSGVEGSREVLNQWAAEAWQA